MPGFFSPKIFLVSGILSCIIFAEGPTQSGNSTQSLFPWGSEKAPFQWLEDREAFVQQAQRSAQRHTNLPEPQNPALGDFKNVEKVTTTWEQMKLADLEMAAQVAGTYKGHRIFVIGRDAEGIFDTLRMMGESAKLINLSRTNGFDQRAFRAGIDKPNPRALEYLDQTLLPHLARGEKIVLVDTGWKGTLINELILKRYPQYQDQIKGKFSIFIPDKKNGYEKIPSTRAHLLGLKPELSDSRDIALSPHIFEGTLKKYELLRAQTQFRSNNFARKDEGGPLLPIRTQKPSFVGKENGGVDPPLALLQAQDRAAFLFDRLQMFEGRKALAEELTQFAIKNRGRKHTIVDRVKSKLALTPNHPMMEAHIRDLLDDWSINFKKEIGIEITPPDVGLTQEFKPFDTARKLPMQADGVFIKRFLRSDPTLPDSPISVSDQEIALEFFISSNRNGEEQVKELIKFYRKNRRAMGDPDSLSVALEAEGISRRHAVESLTMINEIEQRLIDREKPKWEEKERVRRQNAKKDRKLFEPRPFHYIPSTEELLKAIEKEGVDFPIRLHELSENGQAELALLLHSKVSSIAGRAARGLGTQKITSFQVLSIIQDAVVISNDPTDLGRRLEAYALLRKNSSYPGVAKYLENTQKRLRETAAWELSPDAPDETRGEKQEAESLLRLIDVISNQAKGAGGEEGNAGLIRLGGKPLSNISSEDIFKRLEELIVRADLMRKQLVGDDKYNHLLVDKLHIIDREFIDLVDGFYPRAHGDRNLLALSTLLVSADTISSDVQRKVLDVLKLEFHTVKNMQVAARIVENVEILSETDIRKEQYLNAKQSLLYLGNAFREKFKADIADKMKHWKRRGLVALDGEGASKTKTPARSGTSHGYPDHACPLETLVRLASPD